MSRQTSLRGRSRCGRCRNGILTYGRPLPRRDTADATGMRLHLPPGGRRYGRRCRGRRQWAAPTDEGNAPAHHRGLFSLGRQREDRKWQARGGRPASRLRSVSCHVEKSHAVSSGPGAAKTSAQSSSAARPPQAQPTAARFHKCLAYKDKHFPLRCA